MPVRSETSWSTLSEKSEGKGAPVDANGIALNDDDRDAFGSSALYTCVQPPRKGGRLLLILS